MLEYSFDWFVQFIQNWDERIWAKIEHLLTCRIARGISVNHEEWAV